MGRYDEAIAEAQNALRIYPGLAEAHLIIGRAHTGKGEKDQARSAYRKAREVDPNAARFVEKQLRLLDEAPAPPDRPSPP